MTKPTDFRENVINPEHSNIVLDFTPIKPKIGMLDPKRGIYLGKYEELLAYAADDFLRDDKGQQILLNFIQAYAELTKRNDNRLYGNGTEADVRKAITEGRYQDGDLVLPPMKLLHGINAHGDNVRPQENIYHLMKNGHFPKIIEAISRIPTDAPWILSNSEHPSFTSLISYMTLQDGYDDWVDKNLIRSGIVPLRLYKPGPSISRS